MILIKNISYKYLNKPEDSVSTVLSILGKRPLQDIIKEIWADIPNKEVPITGIKGPIDKGSIDPLSDDLQGLS
ncbi:hypothetical protein [Paenibacillus polymyxa]|uniref:hypothetical protein n=1 Tax=Paenibacillus polymyxa TaxID=1406 RepID=UPI002ED3A299